MLVILSYLIVCFFLYKICHVVYRVEVFYIWSEKIYYISQIILLIRHVKYTLDICIRHWSMLREHMMQDSIIKIKYLGPVLSIWNAVNYRALSHHSWWNDDLQLFTWSRTCYSCSAAQDTKYDVGNMPGIGKNMPPHISSTNFQYHGPLTCIYTYF